MSLPVTPERTVSDVLADLDLDDALKDAVPPPLCEMTLGNGRLPCNANAEGLRVAQPCGHSLYACLRCHTGWLTEHAAHQRRQGVVVMCDYCRVEVLDIEWRPL